MSVNTDPLLAAANARSRWPAKQMLFGIGEIRLSCVIARNIRPAL